MRISDWSSDVCSSDLLRPGLGPHGLEHRAIRLNRILSVAGHDHDFATKPSGTARKLRSRCGNGISMPASRNAASIAKRRSLLTDRKSVVEGKRVSVRVSLGGRRTIKKKKQNRQ